MATLRRMLFSTLIGMFGLAMGTAVAAACTCPDRSTAEHAAEADVVARVVVERVNLPVEGTTDEQPATYTVRPIYVWKGDVISQFKVTSEASEADCGLVGIYEGQDLVVFANIEDDSFSADLCGGTAPASEDLVVELLEVVGPGVAIELDPGDQPGIWIWPTVMATAAVAFVTGAVVLWWKRLHKQED